MILNSIKKINTSGFVSCGFRSLGASFLVKNMSFCPLKTPPIVFKINAPQQFSQDLVNKLQCQFSSTSLSIIKNFKPTSYQHLESQQDFFEKLLNKYPEFKQQIEQASNSSIVLISGLKVPDLLDGEVPTSKYEANQIYNYPQTKIAELVAGLMVNKFVNFSDRRRIFDAIYPTNQDVDRNDSFASSKELLWHNDGWAQDPEGQVALFCINGNKSAITEVINSQQIIDYFKSHNKEHLLMALHDDFEIVAGGEEYFRQRAKILDSDKIRYAKYGKFISLRGDKKLRHEAKEAIDELNKCLENIVPALSLSLQNGDLLLIDNTKNLHRRKTADSESAMKPGSRLLFRARIEDSRKNNESKNLQR